MPSSWPAPLYHSFSPLHSLPTHAPIDIFPGSLPPITANPSLVFHTLQPIVLQRSGGAWAVPIAVTASPFRRRLGSWQLQRRGLRTGPRAPDQGRGPGGRAPTAADSQAALLPWRRLGLGGRGLQFNRTDSHPRAPFRLRRARLRDRQQVRQGSHYASR